MNQNAQGGMKKSQAVQQQLDRLEEQNATNDKNEKGSTNEIQPMANDEGVTQ